MPYKWLAAQVYMRTHVKLLLFVCFDMTGMLGFFREHKMWARSVGDGDKNCACSRARTYSELLSATCKTY